MPQLAERLRLLTMSGVIPAADAARVLIATLEYAEPGERDAIVGALLRLQRPEATAAAIRFAHLLSESTLAQFGEPAIDLHAPLRSILARGEELEFLNAIDVIRLRNDVTLLPYLLEAITSNHQVVRDRAGEALLRFIVEHLGETGRRRVCAETSRAIDEAVASALDGFPQHRQRAALLAAAIVAAKPGPKVMAILDDPRSPPSLSLRSLVQDVEEPLVRRNLLRWLGNWFFSRPVRRSLHLVRRTEWWNDVLASGHLLRSPDRRRAMRHVERAMRCIPAEGSARLSDSGQRWLADWIAPLGMRRSRRIEYMAEGVVFQSPMARMRAVCHLAALGSAAKEAVGALELFTLDREAAVARAAAAAVLPTRSSHDAAFLRRMVNDGMPEVARMARRRLARLDISGFFAEWLDMNDARRAEYAFRLVARDRRRFVEELRGRLTNAPRDTVLAGFALARRLRLVDHFDDDVLLQTANTDPRVASAAVSCLADVHSPKREDAARAALRHADARVRANAIETIRAWGAESLTVEIIAPLMVSRQNRSRANAIRAMVEVKPEHALGHLQAMLRDRDPLHRVSALWVATRSRSLPCIAEVAMLARVDPNVLVRTRAAALERAILARSRHEVSRAKQRKRATIGR